MFPSRLTICFTYTICGDSSGLLLPVSHKHDAQELADEELQKVWVYSEY